MIRYIIGNNYPRATLNSVRKDALGHPAYRVSFFYQGRLETLECYQASLWHEKSDECTRCGALLVRGACGLCRPALCVLCNLPADVHGHGETGRFDSHTFQVAETDRMLDRKRDEEALGYSFEREREAQGDEHDRESFQRMGGAW